MNEKIQKELQARIEAFGADVTRLLQKAMVEAMSESLKSLPRQRGAALKVGRGRRASFPAVSPDALLKEVTREGGRRIEELAKSMNVHSKALGPVMKKLVADKKVKASGKARGTKYRAA